MHSGPNRYPSVNERELLAYLRDLSQPVQSSDLRHLCILSVLACRDRGVQRSFFIDMLQLIESMIDDVALMDRTSVLERAVMLLDARQSLDPQAVPPGESRRLPRLLREKLHETHAEFTGKRLQLAELVALLTECPAIGDTIS